MDRPAGHPTRPAHAPAAGPARPRLCGGRTAPARQRQLPPLCRSEAPRRRVERSGRAAGCAHAAHLVLSGDGLHWLPGLLCPSRCAGRGRPAGRPGAGGGCVRRARLLHAGLHELGRGRPAAEHLRGLARGRLCAPAVPRTGAPGGVRPGRYGVQRIVCHGGRAPGQRPLDGRAQHPRGPRRPGRQRAAPRPVARPDPHHPRRAARHL